MRSGDHGRRVLPSGGTTGRAIPSIFVSLCVSLMVACTMTVGVMATESWEGIPGPPTNLVAYGGDGYANLTWDPPEDDGGSPVLYYTIFRGSNPDLMSNLGIIGNVTGYNDNSVENGLTYYYRVSALNVHGEGNRSDAASVTPLGVPDVPASVGASRVGGTVKITWGEPAQDGGSSILNYRLYRGTSPGQLILYSTVGSTTFSYTDGNVAEGSVYYYRVMAVNEVGDGPLSATVSVSFVEEGESYDLLILAALAFGAVAVVAVVLVRRLRR